MSVDPSLQMWATLLLTAAAVVLFVTEWVQLEVTALGLLVALLLLFHLFPVLGPDGEPVLTVRRLLEGFGNPALIAVLALLVVGEGLVRTGALDGVARFVGGLPLPPVLMILAALVAVAVFSAFLNNTPMVVIFIPIMQGLATRTGLKASRMMMPLSFAAILGGMTTLIGSSTNLLVSSSLISLGLPGLGFFEFTGIAAVLAVAGLAYVVLVAPRLLPDRASMVATFTAGGHQFLAQGTVPADSPLVGEAAVAGMFRSLPDVTVQMILRGERGFLPPFDDVALRPGDVLVVAAPRKALTDAAARHPGLFHPPRGADGETGRERVEGEKGRERGREESEQIMAEAMVPPASRLVGFSLSQIGFRRRYNCVVLGIQRRARMIRGRMTDIRLEPGDVLLVQGRAENLRALQADRDLVLISGSTGALPKPHHARTAAVIFLAAIVPAALGMVPVVISALAAAAALVAVGAINVRQAVRALDRRVVLLVASALALGAALEATGGAAWLATVLLSAVGDGGLLVTLSAFFLIVALFTNVLSNNACAVLFTPIAVNLATRLEADPHLFAIATLLAANTSFASPIGYQTNLLVMGPGHYRFADFVRAGLPLTLLTWLVFTLVAPLFWMV